MHGFKSFAKRTDLGFNDDFSVILGPNGSGKSNVLDALCFVLGRMSSKSLRSEKMGHLIYNGGKKKEPANRAEVSIFFDNAKKIFPVETPELKVSRFIKASGQSIYKVNDVNSTRQQLLEILGLARIEPEGHNIILQGDIINFVEMSAENRRMLLEEVAGISVYEERKKKAMNEMERVGERLRESEILLGERKQNLRELRKDRDQAIKFKEVSDKIKQNKATYTHALKENKEKRLESYEKNINEQQERIKRITEQITKDKGRIEEKKKVDESLATELEQKGQEEEIKLSKEIEQIRVDIGTTKSKIELTGAELGKIVLRREQLNTEHAEIEKKQVATRKQQEELTATITEQQQSLNKINQKIGELTADTELGGVAALEKDITEIETNVEKQEQESQILTEQKQMLLREKDRLEIHLEGYGHRAEKLKQLEAEQKEEVAQLKAKQARFKKVMMDLNKELAHNTTLAASLGNLRKRYQSMTEEQAKVRTRMLMSQEQSAANKAAQYITTQKNIAGVYGLLSQLGTVKNEYALALEIAAGPRINSVVVRDDTTATKCIAELKEKRMGIATFLPLNKIKGKVLAEKEGTGIHGSAIKLVSFDSKYKNAFAYVFGATLIVDNINVARRIGVGTQRMVTLDGDVIELSGAMQGGYRKRKAGSFQEQNTAKRYDELEQQMSELSAELSTLEKSKSENEETITTFRAERAELEGEVIKIEKSLHLTKEESAEQTEEKSIKIQLDNTEQRLEKIEQKLATEQHSLAEVKTKRSQIREKLATLRNPTALAELNAFEAKRRELDEHIGKIRNENDALLVQEKQIQQPELKRIQEVLKQLAREEQKIHQEREQLKKRIPQKTKELEQAELRSSKFKTKYRQLFEKRAELAKEIQTVEEKIIRNEEGINLIEVKMNDMLLKKGELTSDVATLKEELQQYTDIPLLKNKTEEELKEDIRRYERSAIGMGDVNMKALQVYDEVEKQYNALVEKKQKLEREKEDVMMLMGEIEGKKKELFMNTFEAINERFKKIFSTLSSKGDAYLLLENEKNPFEGGLRVNVRITGNKFLDIRSLSGGEKVMTALSFIFAIQEYEPASFYILDEVDAALDKKNSEKLAGLIKSYAAKAQYIVISHNDNVIASAQQLYGVSMDENGISNVVSVKV